MILEYNIVVRNKPKNTLAELFPYLIVDTDKENRKQKIEIGQLTKSELKKYRLVVENFKGALAPYSKYFRTISFTVKEGESFGVVGPINSGRTDLCRKLAGYDKAVVGSLYINGINIRDKGANAKNMISLAFNNYQIESFMTGYECLEVLCYSRGVKYRRKLIETLIEVLGLRNVIFRKLKDLAKSDIKKFHLATALIGNADVLILDDPTLRLDSITRQVIWRVIGFAQRLGKSVILSTDSVVEADYFTDKVVFLVEGNVYGLTSLLEVRTLNCNGFFIETRITQLSGDDM